MSRKDGCKLRPEAADLIFCIIWSGKSYFYQGKVGKKSGIFVMPVAAMSQKYTEFAGL